MPKRSQVIVDDYLRQIASGQMVEGQLLPTETALIERYHVSRTAVREAIQALSTKGFALIRQGSGTTVAPRTRWNVLDQDYLEITGFGRAMFQDLFETRHMFEPAIAGLAAQHANAVDVQALRAILANLAAAGERDALVHAELDIAFHHRLSECTANPILISIHDSISHLGRAQRRLMVSDAGAVERAAFWHEYIVDAIAAGDAAAAQDAMRMHLRQVHTDLNASLVEAVTGPTATGGGSR